MSMNNPLWYEVHTWINDSSCQIKMIDNITSLIK